jgi:hypothetical protein
MSGDGGRHFASCFSFHVLCDIRRADYKGDGGEQIKYGMVLSSWIIFLKQISICIIKVLPKCNYVGRTYFSKSE